MSQLHIQSRLPNVGSTIFSVMSALAVQHKAVNLGQGFPDFGCDPHLLELVTEAMQQGHNQYPPMAGVPVLRQTIAQKVARLYGHQYDPETEITVTAGATQGIMCAIQCSVHPGDEVIVIEPAYDCYLPAIQLAGGIPITVSMEINEQGFSVNWAKLAAKITPKTRLIIINSPNNPTGSVLQRSDLNALADILREPHNAHVLLLSDEVYEHMVYDGAQHVSVSAHPELAKRAFVISSFGKTFHVTGWKVGYVTAPAALMTEFKKVHQFTVFTVNTPMQYGLAAYLQNTAPYENLSDFYQAKRDYFRAGLSQSRFKLLPAQGTYFQCVDYSAISDLPELAFAEWLTKEIGVAAIPVSAFYRSGMESGLVRFCFAKQEQTLALALEKLVRI
ncbi:pyridoxal phosphate-dependent aminotransferase [Sapientia aquatica]|uniref:Pyridoxal phosphate-dependent aminotransferase n=1 Tax=Sapientia aquatica TaxID=1549640 RepID=A0A4V3AUN1_9BURK|nr:pyridoxal phosphate-dependent aminotransferase [Sapientia aquatica]TDK65510.1 pyridoxal phosphate-dependent aminotransferase [Sapientia aquatica]